MFGSDVSPPTRDRASFTVTKFQSESSPWDFAGKEGIGTEFFATNMKKRGLFWGSP
jgi:hypothetical protein